MPSLGGPSQRSKMGPRVIVEKSAEDSSLLEEQMGRAISALSLSAEWGCARAIFIKPNLTYPVFRKGVTTRREFVECLIRSLRRINSDARIYVGEGDGGYNSFSMSAALREMGFYELERLYPNVRVVNLSEQPTREVVLSANGRPYPIRLPEMFFEEVDFSISCPLPKVHCMTRVTLSLKNQWGCLPDTMRMKNHPVFDQIIWQIADALKFRYAFLDGKYGLDENGPMVGVPVEVNWFVAANSLGAFDMIVAEMMGVRWRDVRHLRMAKQSGFLPDRESIEIIGSPEELRRRFRLKRNFWNYPALAAFRSKALTHLLYFSRIAKPLHDIMYAFRERAVISK